MKRLFIFTFTLLVAIAAANAQQKFVIKGTAPKDITAMKLYSLDGRAKTIADIPVNNGKFSYTYNKESDHQLLAIGTDKAYIRFFTEGKDVEVDWQDRLIAKGSANNKRISWLETYFDACDMRVEAEWNARPRILDGNPKDDAEMYAKMREIIEKRAFDDKLQELIKEKNSPVAAAFLPDLMYEMSYEQLSEFVNADRPYYDYPCMRNVVRYTSALEKKRPGLKFTDVALQDMTGKTVRLSDYVGKGNYVLIDFWASWCGPCRREMPTVVESYKLYHDKGYEIVGVSFDNNGDAWKQAVEAMGMTWPQMSDLKGWQCAAAAPYGVMSIPSNVLVDPQGTIIAADLRGQALIDKLKEIYK